MSEGKKILFLLPVDLTEILDFLGWSKGQVLRRLSAFFFVNMMLALGISSVFISPT